MGTNTKGPLVAILIVLFNEEEHIPRLLNSLKNQTYRNLQVFVMDNHSADNSADLFESIMPTAFIFRAHENHGYAQGNNLISEKALKNKPVYLFILNTDMELDPDCIKNLVTEAELNKSVCALSPIILSGIDDTQTLKTQSYEIVANFSKGTYQLVNRNLAYALLQEKVYTDILPGCAFLIRASSIAQIGLFNADNFMYGEEIDLAYRAKKAGHKMLAMKNAKAWHFHEWSRSNTTGYYLTYYYMMRNRFLFFQRYQKFDSLLLEGFKELCYLPLKIRWALKKADIKLVKYYYLGMLHGLLNKKGKANIKFE